MLPAKPLPARGLLQDLALGRDQEEKQLQHIPVHGTPLQPPQGTHGAPGVTPWGLQALHPPVRAGPTQSSPRAGGTLPLPARGGFQEPVKALFPLLAGPSTFGTSSSPCRHQGPAKLFRIKSLISFPLGSKHAEREGFQTSKPHLSPAGAPQGPPIPTPMPAFPTHSSRLLARSQRFCLSPSSSELSRCAPSPRLTSPLQVG